MVVLTVGTYPRYVRYSGELFSGPFLRSERLENFSPGHFCVRRGWRTFLRAIFAFGEAGELFSGLFSHPERLENFSLGSFRVRRGWRTFLRPLFAFGEAGELFSGPFSRSERLGMPRNCGLWLGDRFIPTDFCRTCFISEILAACSASPISDVALLSASGGAGGVFDSPILVCTDVLRDPLLSVVQ